jgi:myosin-crossreactive antigen
MAANTGPDVNTYQIPEVALGDTFNTWRDITNTAVYKLNKLKVYEGISSGSISITTTTGGTLSVALLETITTGHTFTGNINFGGVVTFNGSTVTMNAQTVTIDDYNIVLGDLAGASAAGISAAGGGGFMRRRRRSPGQHRPQRL